MIKYIKTPFKIEINNKKECYQVLLILESYGYTFNTKESFEKLVPNLLKNYSKIIFYIRKDKDLSYSESTWQGANRPKYGPLYTAQEFLNNEL